MLSAVRAWAQQVFGKAKLGDVRRTERLVQYAALQAASVGVSTLAACDGDAAAAEGAYRFVRSKFVDDNIVASAGYDATLKVIRVQLLSVDGIPTSAHHTQVRFPTRDHDRRHLAVGPG